MFHERQQVSEGSKISFEEGLQDIFENRVDRIADLNGKIRDRAEKILWPQLGNLYRADAVDILLNLAQKLGTTPELGLAYDANANPYDSLRIVDKVVLGSDDDMLPAIDRLFCSMQTFLGEESGGKGYGVQTPDLFLLLPLGDLKSLLYRVHGYSQVTVGLLKHQDENGPSAFRMLREWTFKTGSLISRIKERFERGKEKIKRQEDSEARRKVASIIMELLPDDAIKKLDSRKAKEC